jgi:predicted permease
MRRIRASFIRITGIFNKSKRDRELSAELESHLQLHIDDNLRAGMSSQEARRRAIIKLGGIESTKEIYRDRRSIPIIETLLQDVRFGLRMLRRNPGFALAVVLTLALGIGANVTMFSVVDSLLFRMPQHVRAPEQLVSLFYRARPPKNYTTANFPGYQSILENSRLLDLVSHDVALQDFGRGTEARQINVDFISQNYFDVLGAKIQIGRGFEIDEDQNDHSVPVAVLSEHFWQQQFGGDPRILGKELWIGERKYTVIGVAPKGFNGVSRTTLDAWLPIADDPGPDGLPQPLKLKISFVSVFGRLRGNATLSTAGTEADSIYLHSGADPQFIIRTDPLFPSRTAHLSDNARISLWLTGVAFMVLLIACANVTNLFLVRMVRRKHEMAIRLQLGASRGRLIRQVLVESLLLSAIGGAAATLVITWASPLVRGFLLPPGFFTGSLLNYKAIGMTVFFAALAGIASGITPAWRASRPDIVEALKSGDRGHSSEQSALRSSLLVAQVALTLILITGAGLFIRSLRNIQAINLGFEPDRALVATVDLRRAGYSSSDINASYERMLNRIVSMPGVDAAGLSTSLPLQSQSFSMVGFPAESSPSKTKTGSGLEIVTPGYFAALGIRLIAGRALLPTDRAGAPSVAVVNEDFGKEIWPGQDPIGKCVQVGTDANCRTIVGVVKNTSAYLILEDPSDKKKLYLPFDQTDRNDQYRSLSALVIRTSGKPSSSVRDLFLALESAVPGQRYVDVKPLERSLDSQTRSWRLGASMFSFFDALALSLAGVGIYGVLAFLVRQRVSEIGIRMALGALPRDILKLVIWQGMKSVALGIVIGAAAALGLTRLARSLLYQVKPADVTSYLAACAVLVAVALMACLIPAWRAARVDPASSLRYE